MEIISEMETLRSNDKGNATKRIPIIEIARSKKEYSYSEEEAESDDSNYNHRPTYCPCKTESVVDTSNESRNKYKSSKRIPLQQSMSTGSETSSASVDSWSSGREGCKLATSLTSVNSDQFTSDAESDNENDLNRVKNQPDELVDNFDKLTLLHVDQEHDTELTVPKKNIVIRNLTPETPRRDSNSNYQANDKIGHKNETVESDNYGHRKVGFDEEKTKVDNLDGYTSSSGDESDDHKEDYIPRGKYSSKSSPRYDPYRTERPSSTFPYEQPNLAESPVPESEKTKVDNLDDYTSSSGDERDDHKEDYIPRGKDSSKSSPRYDPYPTERPSSTVPYEQPNLAESPVPESESLATLDPHEVEHFLREVESTPSPTDECKHHSLKEPAAELEATDEQHFQLNDFPTTWEARNCVALPLPSDASSDSVDGGQPSPPTYNIPLESDHVQRLSDKFEENLPINGGFSSIFSTDLVIDSFSLDPVEVTSLPQPDTRDMNYLPGTVSTRNTSMYRIENHLQFSNISPQGSGSDIINQPASDLLLPFEVIRPERQKQPVYGQSECINSNLSQPNIASSTAEILLYRGIAPTGGSVTVINQNSLNSNSQNSTTTLDSQLKPDEFSELDRWPMPPSATSSRKVSSASNHIIPIPVRDIQTASTSPPKRNERQIHPWHKYFRIPETSASKRLHEELVPGDLEKAGKTLLDRKYSLENLLRSPNCEDHSYLMAIVRDPKALACDLKYIIPIVARMKEKDPESLMLRNTRGEDALYLSAIKCPEMPFVAGFLAASIAETSMRDKMTRRTYDEGKNNTLIHAVAARGDTHVNVLLDLIALKSSMDVHFDLSAKNNEGKTPLHVAVEVHNPTVTRVTSMYMIQALLQHGADPTVPENRGGDTALHLAISQRRSGIVQPIVSGQVEDHKRCLKTHFFNEISLCIVRYLEKQALLQEPGNSAVNAQNYDGNTPVHLAAADSEVSLFRQKQICRMLIDAGGRTNIGNNRHQMPVVLVSRSRKEEIKNILHKKL